MTEDRMALPAIAEKAGETDFLRDLVREVVQEAYIQACPRARSTSWSGLPG